MPRIQPSREIIRSTQDDPINGFPVHRGKQRNSSPNGNLVGIIGNEKIIISDSNFNQEKGFDSIHLSYGENKQLPISPNFKYTLHSKSTREEPQIYTIVQNPQTKKYHFQQIN